MARKAVVGDANKAAKRPWRIQYMTAKGSALIKGADETIVAVVHADNAELMVRAVNAYTGSLGSEVVENGLFSRPQLEGGEK